MQVLHQSDMTYGPSAKNSSEKLDSELNLFRLIDYGLYFAAQYAYNSLNISIKNQRQANKTTNDDTPQSLEQHHQIIENPYK